MEAGRQTRGMRDADRGEVAVRDMALLGQRPLVPGDLVVELALEVGEVVGEDAALGVLALARTLPAPQELLAAGAATRPVTRGLRPR